MALAALGEHRAGLLCCLPRWRSRPRAAVSDAMSEISRIRSIRVEDRQNPRSPKSSPMVGARQNRNAEVDFRFGSPETGFCWSRMPLGLIPALPCGSPSSGPDRGQAACHRQDRASTVSRQHRSAGPGRPACHAMAGTRAAVLGQGAKYQGASWTERETSEVRRGFR